MPRPTTSARWAIRTGCASRAWPGIPFVIQTSNLSAGGDTVLYLYGPGGALLAFNDDFGPGGASSITYTLPTAGTYYVQAVSFDTNSFGTATDYSLTVQADIPPTPTPTPTPTRTPTPTPVATPPPSTAHTLILVNRQRVEDLYGADASWQLMDKLYEYAARPEVAGLVAQVELDPSVAAAYAAWTLNEQHLAEHDPGQQRGRRRAQPGAGLRAGHDQPRDAWSSSATTGSSPSAASPTSRPRKRTSTPPA